MGFSLWLFLEVFDLSTKENRHKLKVVNFEEYFNRDSQFMGEEMGDCLRLFQSFS